MPDLLSMAEPVAAAASGVALAALTPRLLRQRRLHPVGIAALVAGAFLFAASQEWDVLALRGLSWLPRSEALEAAFATIVGLNVLSLAFRALREQTAMLERAASQRVLLAAQAREVERLRQIDAFKSQFINHAAHELGTPLTPIRIQLHLLGEALEDPDAQGRRKSFQLLERNVERLDGLLRRIVQAARLQSGELGLQPATFDLAAALREAVGPVQATAAGRGVALRVACPGEVAVDGDRGLLVQAALALVDNAVRATPAGGAVDVRCAAAAGEARVEVRDTGAGLTEAQLARLFQPFGLVQDPMERTHGGIGLGLYLARGIAKLHHGHLTAASDGPGLGATFTLVVPRAGGPLPGAVEADASPFPTP